MTQQELIQKTNDCISELVYEKTDLQKAYNYYAGKRDEKQFEYLEKNYGIGNPTSVSFTPLVKKHIDALIGEFLGVPTLPKISCKDSDTISNITREKQLKIANSLHDYLKGHFKNSLLSFIDNKDITDKAVKEQMDNMIKNINQSFVSRYEIAAQNVIEYIMQSKETDIETKRRQLFLDLLISGTPCYKVQPSSSDSNIELTVLDPLNTFFDRNPNSIYIKDSYRIVVRKWLTRTQILATYGKELSAEDVKKLKDRWLEFYSTYSGWYVREDTLEIDSRAIDNRQTNHPGHPVSQNWLNQIIPVYEVEWLETDKDFVMQRYSSVRIGEGIYILRGKDEHVVRSHDNPTYASLSVNGVFFLNRSNEPYSLMKACMDTQDKYDLLIYYRDNLIASSGNIGDWIDISLIPKNLGVDFPERVQKWIAYKKSGLGILDTTQEGRNNTGTSPLNTIFNGFDNTVKLQAIQAIQIAIDALENTLSSITGVFRERLNGIQYKDAVTNIQQGVNNSFVVTKQYYQQMDTITCEILTDCLDQAKIVWKNGLTGTLVLGDEKQRIFTALPEEFTVTDYDIHVISTTKILQEIQQLWSVVPEFIRAGQLPPDIMFDVMSAKSLTEIKSKVKLAMEENNAKDQMIQQLQQKLEQAGQQAQQLQQELQKTAKELESANSQKLEIEAEKAKMDNKVEWYKAETDRTFKETQARLAEKRTDIQIMQLRDGNPYNDKIASQGYTSMSQ